MRAGPLPWNRGDMDAVWVWRGLAGGGLIGLSASVLWLLNGHVAGISGIVNTLAETKVRSERSWRAVFVAGLVLGGVLASAWFSDGLSAPMPSWPMAAGAGVLVGVGTRLANGCTSGHGVCGLSRFSGRSLAATLTFIGTGALTVFLLRAFGGGAS